MAECAELEMQLQLLPLIWSVVSVVFHALSILAFRIVTAASRTAPGAGRHAETRVGLPRKARHGQGLVEELKTCIAHTPVTVWPAQPELVSISLHCLAQGLAAAHVIFGTIVFSSLLFLRVWDALPVISRFALSAIVCRVILTYELAGMSKTVEVSYVNERAEKDQGSEKERKQRGGEVGGEEKHDGALGPDNGRDRDEGLVQRQELGVIGQHGKGGEGVSLENSS